MPTLLIAGKQDRLRLPGYAQELGKRIPDCKVSVYDRAQHCPHIEHAARFNREAIAFLRQTHRKLGVKAR